MISTFKTTIVSALILVSVSACSTMPKSSTLMAGIDETQLSQIAPNTLRGASDPVCVNFYKNAQQFIAEANKPNPGRNFLTNLGVSVLAGVATAGVVPSGLSTVGQMAASQAVSSTVSQGSGLVLQGMKQNSGATAKITEAAAEIGCPVSTGP